MNFIRVFAVAACLAISVPARAGNIIWASFITDPAGNDAPFFDLLVNNGHDVSRFFVQNNLAPTPTELLLLNSAELVIVGRAVNSGSFDSTRAPVWNEQITAPIIYMSAYVTRRNRLGMATGDSVPDSGAAKLVATDPGHPIFTGISFQGDGVTMANDYNVLIDRGASTIANPLVGVAGVETFVIATNPSIVGGIAIAEWQAGTTVQDEGNVNMTLVGPRYFFAGGSREASGAVTNAGKMDLTADGQQLFLNTVNYVLGVPIGGQPKAELTLDLSNPTASLDFGNGRVLSGPFPGSGKLVILNHPGEADGMLKLWVNVTGVADMDSLAAALESTDAIVDAETIDGAGNPNPPGNPFGLPGANLYLKFGPGSAPLSGAGNVGINYDFGAGSGVGGFAVPEPSTLLLAAAGLSLLALRRTRRFS